MDFKKLLSKISGPSSTLPDRVVGIDIGSSAVKVVELEQTDKALVLRTYGELQLGPYADKELGETVTLDQETLAEALVDVMRESKVKANYGVLSMPLNTSFVTVVPISIKENETLEAKINVEARKYIPVPLADVALDWTCLHQYGDKSQEVYEVLFAAIQNEALARYQKLMANVKLSSQPTEIEVFSTIRSVLSPQEQTLGVIDLGAETSKLFIVREGSLERIHRVYDGGTASTRRLASLLEIPFAEAEELKCTYTTDAPHAHDINKTVSASLERSIQEFDRVIKQYEARFGEKLDRVVITGGVTAFPTTQKFIGDVLARDVVKAHPFNKVAFPAFMEDTLNEIGISFTTALGAAVRPYEMVD